MDLECSEQDTMRNKLLSRIQSSFPLVHDPYQVLAEDMGIPVEEVYRLMEDGRAKGFIRRMGPVFDSYKLGYVSILCATKVADSQIDRVSEYINSFPNVTHNYLRDNPYNLWFTVIAYDEQELRRIVECIEEFSESPVLSLPALRLFKIKVDFNLTDEVRDSMKAKVVVPQKVVVLELSEPDKGLIDVLQQDSFEGRYPFAATAEKASKALRNHVSEQYLLDTLTAWKDVGAIRRFGVTLRHHKVGLAANVMVVWDVPDEQVEQAGEIMADQNEVSHCYERPRVADWQYNLYTMLHGRTAADCDRVIKRTREALHEADIAVEESLKLYTLRELKKTNMKYFCEGK